MNPFQQGRHRYVIGDLQPGDVLRSGGSRAIIVHDVAVDADDPSMRIVRWAPDGRTESRLPTERPLYGDLVATGPDAHYPVCGVCGEVWPCIHTKALHGVARAIYDESVRCHHCGESTATSWKTVTVVTVTERGAIRELVFHGKKGPCLTAARRLDPRCEVTS